MTSEAHFVRDVADWLVISIFSVIFKLVGVIPRRSENAGFRKAYCKG